VLLWSDEPDRGEMRVVARCLQRVTGHGRDVGCLEDREPLLRRAAGQGGSAHGEPFSDVHGSRRDARETLVVEKLFLPDRVQERSHLGVCVDGDADPAVLRPERLVLGIEQALIPNRTHGRLETALRQMLLQDEGCHRLEHRHFQRRSRPGRAAFEDRGQDRTRGDLAGDMVADQHRHVGGRAVARERQARHAGRALDHAVVGRTAGIRTVGPIPGDQAVDLVGMPVAHRDGIEAAAFEGLWPHVSDHDVCGGDQPANRLRRAGLLEIEADVLLAAVEVQVGARMLPGRRLAAEPSHEVACRSFDLHDLGAILAEPPRADRPDDHACQVEHTNALKGRITVTATSQAAETALCTIDGLAGSRARIAICQ